MKWGGRNRVTGKGERKAKREEQGKEEGEDRHATRTHGVATKPLRPPRSGGRGVGVPETQVLMCHTGRTPGVWCQPRRGTKKRRRRKRRNRQEKKEEDK